MNARREISASIVLLVLGIGYLGYNTCYPMNTWADPGPAVFPLMVGGVFVLLSLAHLFRSVRQGRVRTAQGGLSLTLPGLRSKPFLLIVICLVYLLLMKVVGFYISNLLFVIGCSRLIGARDWIRPFSLAAGIDLFCYLLFEVWLKVSLPKGLI